MAKEQKDAHASDAEGAGTIPAEAAPSTDAKDAQIAALQAQLAALQAQGTLAQIQAAIPAPTPVFTAPTAPLIGKYDSVTELVQWLPQKMWDQLSDEDQKRFADYVADKPEKLETV